MMSIRNFFSYIKENLLEIVETLKGWEHSQYAIVTNSVDWAIVGNWMFMFLVFLVLTIWLFRYRSVFDWLIKRLSLFAIIVWLLGVFVYVVGLYMNSLSWFAVVPRAVIASFKMFTGTHDLARIPAFLQHDCLYMTMFSFVHFAAVFIATLFVFKMIGYKIKSSCSILYHRYFKRRKTNVHLFWGINEASCLLAEDIHKCHSTETIILVDIDDESVDDSQKKADWDRITNMITIKNREMARLDRIKALVDHCKNGPAAQSVADNMDIFGTLHLRNIAAVVKRSAHANFYFLSNDEAKNITGALNLQCDKLLRSKVLADGNSATIYVHARKDANNEIFDHYSQYNDSKRAKIKIVDSAYLSIEELKQNDRALPVNCVEIDKNTGLVDSPFTSLIVGFGSTGQEAFKFLYEFATFVGSDMKRTPFKCYAIDEKMDKIAGLVKAKMPAINDNELSLIKASVDSEAFWDRVKAMINDLNYVVIALNNDELELSLAVNLLKEALMHRNTNRSMLKIMVRCYNSSSEKRMEEVMGNLNDSIAGNNVELLLFGKEKDLYLCENILADTILDQAKEFNRVYNNSELSAKDQWKKDFGNEQIPNVMEKKKLSRYHAIHDINRRISQNISNALHCRTKMILMGFDETNLSERLKLYYGYVNATREKYSTEYKCNDADAQLLKNMAYVEHERWIASHKLMGYTVAPETDFVKKHHKCMCTWDELDEQTKFFDCKVVDTTIKIEYQKALEENKKAKV